jgi:ABC-type transporter Mla subunit MlaD
MKPLTVAIIGALVVAVAVFGYLYYQRTRNDITIQMPKVELKHYRLDSRL